MKNKTTVQLAALDESKGQGETLRWLFYEAFIFVTGIVAGITIGLGMLGLP